MITYAYIQDHVNAAEALVSWLLKKSQKQRDDFLLLVVQDEYEDLY